MVNPVKRGFSARPFCGGSIIFSQEERAILISSLPAKTAYQPRRIQKQMVFRAISLCVSRSFRALQEGETRLKAGRQGAAGSRVAGRERREDARLEKHRRERGISGLD